MVVIIQMCMSVIVVCRKNSVDYDTAAFTDICEPGIELFSSSEPSLKSFSGAIRAGYVELVFMMLELGPTDGVSVSFLGSRPIMAPDMLDSPLTSLRN